MYLLMGKISGADAPIVFKGAMITRLILVEGGYTALERQTKDIDANWVGEPPAMNVLIDTINDSLGELINHVYAVAFRAYGEKVSAGISIREKQTDEEIISMDIDMRPIHGSRIYHYGEIAVKGVLVDEVLADKLTVLSKQRIFRRVKDMVDIYALAHCVEVHTADVFEMFKKNPSREIGAFDEFIQRRQDVEHAYERLRGITNKPPFDQVYKFVLNFIQPFIKQDMIPRVWNTKKSSWGVKTHAI